jgi:hypothetical protein
MRGVRHRLRPKACPMTTDRDHAIDTALARDQIRDLISRYSHGIDRCDVGSLKTLFWPDGECDYGAMAGNAHEFADRVIEGVRALDRTQHLVGNIMIEIDDPDHARGETYVWAYHDMLDDHGRHLIRIVGGRYLDEFERRGREWRILIRHYLMDWNQNATSTQDWEGWIYGALNRSEGRS